MKSLRELLTELGELGVRVWPEGDRLRFSGPKGAVTAEMRAELQERKAELIEFLSLATRAKGESLSRITPLDRAEEQALPLSYAQERVWFLDQLEGKSPEYNIPAALRLEGTLDLEALSSSLNEIIRRHEVLRASFPSANGRVFQRIARDLKIELPIQDLSSLSAERRASEARRLTEAEAQLPFDLATGPLVRATLLKLAADSHVLLLTKHHVVSDGWSLGILLNELQTIYDAFVAGRSSPLPELRVQYADFAKWQRDWLSQGELERQLSYWKKQMEGAPSLLHLPTDRPRPAVQGFQALMERFVLDAELTAELRKASERSGVTLFMTLLAAYAVLLAKYSGENDLVVGSPVANRNLSDTEPLIGFFVNTLLLRVKLKREMTFAELLADVRTVALDAYAHQDLPFEKLVAELQPERNLGYSPLFQAMFIMQNAPMGKLELRGLREASLEMDVNVVRCDLSLSVEESGDLLNGLLTFKPELFDRATIERFGKRYSHLLASLVRDPHTRIFDLETEPRVEIAALTPGEPSSSLEPLSYHQERMWFIDRFETGTVYETSPTYHNLPLILRFKGQVDVALLERSINAVISRHEALRTRVELDGDRLLQRILPVAPLVIESKSDDTKSTEALIESAIVDSQVPFQIDAGPAVRASVYASHDEMVLALTAHHILVDRASLKLLAREIADEFSALQKDHARSLEPARFQYRQVARAERELSKASLESVLLFWRTELEGPVPVLELPLDRPRPSVHTYTAGRQSLTIGREVSESLERCGLDKHLSLMAILLAAFKVLLHRYARQDEIVVGISDPGRDRQDLSKVVGPLANLLVVRSHLEPTSTFEELTRAVNARVERVRRHRAMPFDLLVREINPEKDMSRTALFDVLFTFEDETRLGSLAFGDVEVDVIETNLGHGKYDLNLQVQRTNDGIDGEIVFNRDFFDDATISQMMRHYERVLATIAVQPGVAIEDIELLSDAEKHQQLVEWNATTSTYPSNTTIHEIFAEQVQRQPHATAIVFGDESLTYSQLDERANRVARLLVERGIARQELVGILLDRSIEMIVAMLGVLRSGGAYLPLDPSHPQERLLFMLSDSGMRHLVTTSDLREQLPESAFEQIRAICLDELSEVEESGQAVDVGGAETDLAYCIYTSGSTGRPKGVLIEHRNVIRLILNDRTPFAFGKHDVWTMFHSYAFDFSVWEVFGALLTGGRVVIVPGEVTKDPKLFLDLLERDGVTVLNQTPAAFYSLSREALRERRPLRLRYVIFGGEALQSVQLRDWNDAYPSVEMINMYGITETTVHVTFKRLGRAEIEANSASIGRPIPTTTTYLLDGSQRLLPRGVPGEICVGGLGVGRGYLNREELTSERFILNPYQATERLYRSGDLARLSHDGEMIYLGRADDQVQIRGFRVETGEIQERLLAHPQVAEAIIVARVQDGQSSELTAYVLPKRGSVSGTASASNGAEDGRTRRYHLPNGMEIFHLNKNETDFLYQEIFEESSYIKHDVTLEDGDCVFDVGANIGLFTLFAGQACRDARIFSFEPIPSTFDVLQRNAELYSLNAKVFQCGIGCDNREELFTSYPHISIFSGRFAVPEEEQKIIKSFVMHQQHEGPTQSVLESAEIDEVLAERMGTEQVVCQLRSLSDVIREEGIDRIDLLKVDVEKGELDLLAGINNEDWPKIQQMVMEVHNVDQRLERIVSLIEGHGFEVTVDQDDWFSETSNHNLYAVRPERKRRVAAGNRARETRQTYRSGSELIADLRRHLKRSLPDYMIPTAIVLLDKVPRTANGKVDRRALPDAGQAQVRAQRTLTAPRTKAEQKVHEIWQDVLGAERVGIHESFFEVGGHSLLATQVISRLRDTFGVNFAVRLLFEAPTIAGLAEAAEKAVAENKGDDGPALVRLSRESRTRPITSSRRN